MTGGRCGSCSGDAVGAAGLAAVAAVEGAVEVAAAAVGWSRESAECRLAGAWVQCQWVESNGLAALERRLKMLL